MTGLARVFDAEFPPSVAPPGCAGVLGYLGGNNAGNVWTLTDWEGFAHLAQFPAWVPAPDENPKASAVRAANAMRQLGWAPWQENRRVVIADLETMTLPGWYQQFAGEIAQQGFSSCAYGSLSTVLANAAADVWAAAFPGDGPALEPGQTMHAHQWLANIPFMGTQVDYSVVDEWLMARAGTGPRHAS